MTILWFSVSVNLRINGFGPAGEHGKNIKSSHMWTQNFRRIGASSGMWSRAAPEAPNVLQDLVSTLTEHWNCSSVRTQLHNNEIAVRANAGALHITAFHFNKSRNSSALRSGFNILYLSLILLSGFRKVSWIVSRLKLEPGQSGSRTNLGPLYRLVRTESLLQNQDLTNTQTPPHSWKWAVKLQTGKSIFA